MKKACIELIDYSKAACLVEGKKGMGRCLFIVILSDDIYANISSEQWLKALKLCQHKATELEYEVAEIRGGALAGLPRTTGNSL